MKRIDKENVKQLLSGVDTILLDCDGVIWGGGRTQVIFKNSTVAINKLKALGKKVFLLTNNAYRTQEQLLENCKSLDINIDSESAVCAPYIMAQYLKKKNFTKKIYVIGPTAIAKELTKWGFQCEGPKAENYDLEHIYTVMAKGELGLDPEVGAVAVDFDRDINYSKLVKANCYLSNPDCLLLANSYDASYPVLNTKLTIPAGGVMVRAVETGAKRTATIVGKPSPLMFEILAAKHGLVPERTLMIGDTLESDISFGNTCGLQTLLVLTGSTSLEDVEKLKTTKEKSHENSLLIPQYYLPSLGDFVSLIE